MSDLKQVPLHDLHLELGAKMVPFAGYAMPVQYAAGVMKEHLHTRARAGLFDVSHMGQVVLWPKTKKYPEAAEALEQLMPIDLLGLKPMRQRYGFFTNEQGGIIDDLMVANLRDHVYLVVNAGCKEGDIAHLREHVSETCDIEILDERALLALQGPEAEAALARIAPAVATMSFMEVLQINIGEMFCVISRSGYTGEDGFEISVANEDAERLARMLLEMEEVAPIGLGARDSLRLEAGLCLYGHDIDATTSPVEAGLAWAIQKVRRAGGERAGGFPGEKRILAELKDGPSRRRTGLLPEGRAPMREGVELFDGDSGGAAVGRVTSGAFGPSVNRPVAMGYVPADSAKPGVALYGELRGKRLPVTTAELPFVPSGYKR